MLGYFSLVLLFLALLSLSFYFGVREWLRPRDDSPLPVDVEYVRQENYFGLSFRAHLEEWLKAAPVSHDSGPPSDALAKEGLPPGGSGPQGGWHVRTVLQ